VKAVARAAFWLNVSVDRRLRRLRGERAHLLGGECRRCARCCEAPAVRANVVVWRLRSLRAAYLWWQARVNGFELAQTVAQGRLLVFRCTHFDWVTRSCDSYDTRPGMCRDYPRNLLFQHSPELLPGCGYRAHPPNAVGLRLALEAQGIPPLQLERLKKDLNLEP
jgi:Fe-S-cluster containining protein